MPSKWLRMPQSFHRMNKYLLINYPEAWSARTHMVLLAALFFIPLLAGLSVVLATDPRTRTPIVGWTILTSILSLLFLAAWILYLMRFNVFKRYGKLTALSSLTNFGLYFIAIGTIFLIPSVMPFVESTLANRAYPDKVLIRDINDINSKICQIEYNNLPHQLVADTFLVSDEHRNYTNLLDTADNGTGINTEQHQKGRTRVDTATLSETRLNADSSIRLNDSIYVLYKSPDYQFVHEYLLDPEPRSQAYTKFEIYNKWIRNYRPVDTRRVKKELRALLVKYEVPLSDAELYDYTADQYGYTNEKLGHVQERVENKYPIDDVNRSLSNISDRKCRWRDYQGLEKVKTWFYATLLCSLLVFVYRHSTNRTFYLSLLTAALLTIFSSLLIVALQIDNHFFALVPLFWLIMSFCVSLLCFKQKGRHVATGIGINLFTMMAAFLPAISYSAYKGFSEYRSVHEPIYYRNSLLEFQTFLFIEVGGVLLLLVLLATYIHQAYKKWYALPDE